MIPETTPRTTVLPKNGVDFQTLQDTFSSRVGELSNRAFYLGKREYDEENPDDEKSEVESYDSEINEIIPDEDLDEDVEINEEDDEEEEEEEEV